MGSSSGIETIKTLQAPTTHKVKSFAIGYGFSWIAGVLIPYPLIACLMLLYVALVCAKSNRPYSGLLIFGAGILRLFLLMAFYYGWRSLELEPDSSVIWLFFWIGPEIGGLAEKAAG